MNNSETSSELNVNFLDNSKLKKDTSETDYYLNLIANQDKTVPEEYKSSELELSDTDNKSSTSSKPAFEEVKIDNSYSEKRNSNNKRSSYTDTTEYNNGSYKDTYDNSYNNTRHMNEQDIRMKKIELLRKLSEIKSKGYKLSKEYTFSSSIEEMQYEYDLLRSFADKRNGIRLYKNLITNACSVIEFANSKYDPFSFKLDGWSEHMHIEVDNYDDVLEELYEKYRGTGGSMPPEMKLLLLILASASAFHFSKSFENKIPGLNEMHRNNSDFIPNLINGKKTRSQFMSEQELNIERQRQELAERERQLKQQMMQNANQVNAPMKQQPSTQPKMNQSYDSSSLFPSNPQENYQNAYHPVNLNPGPPNGLIKNNDQRPVITKSENVNDILRRLHSNEGTEDESSVNNDRILSDVTVSEGGTRRKKGNKPMMVIQ
jgi:hypothetical protein